MLESSSSYQSRSASPSPTVITEPSNLYFVPDEPGWLTKQLASLTTFFSNRHLSESAARDAHRRVYYAGEGVDAGNKALGGAAAYQAFL